MGTEQEASVFIPGHQDDLGTLGSRVVPALWTTYYIRTMVKTQQKIQVRELLGLEKNLVFFLQITLLTTI